MKHNDVDACKMHVEHEKYELLEVPDILSILLLFTNIMNYHSDVCETGKAHKFYSNSSVTSSVFLERQKPRSTVQPGFLARVCA